MDFGLVLKGEINGSPTSMGASKCTSLSVICSENLKSICVSKTEYWPTYLQGGVIVTLYICQKILNLCFLMCCVVGVFLTF